MICHQCGSILPEGSILCPQCGAEVKSVRRREGMAGIRQGRQEARPDERGSKSQPEPTVWAEEVNSFPDDFHRSVDRQKVVSGSQPLRRGQGRKPRSKKRVMINWALLWTVLAVLLVLAMVGAYIFVKLTDQGQLILARMGRDANATALWTYGQELLDQGYLDRSVETFEKAYEMEPEREDLYDRLLQLADAYEAAGRPADAERTYTTLYKDIAPKDASIYRQVARLMESQGRLMELSTFLKMAYEQTGDASFRRQREDLIPSTPTADQEAGTRRAEQDVQLLSKEDYEIYYLLGEEGQLPEDGILYTDPIHLDEGTHIIRAVAVSSDLYSDELRIQYTINLPRPTAPYASLQPGPYERRQRIWLKYNPTEDETLLSQKRIRTEQEEAHLAKLKDITIYYTVDSQTPTSNSPIYTGEPFLLPLGPSTVKAVAVNGYGKVSNVMERTYNVKLRFELYFNDGDEFSEFTVMATDRDAFVRKFGLPLTETPFTDPSVPGDSIQMTYPWGEAKFYMTDKGYILYAVETDSPTMTGPRKTRIGMSETDVTQKFRDMGQEHNQDGSRSIYYDTQNRKFAMMYHLDAFHDRIDYIYYRTDNGVITLSYSLENSRVVQMSIRCDFY